MGQLYRYASVPRASLVTAACTTGRWGRGLGRTGYSTHLTTPRDRVPKIMLNCRPNGRRRLGRPVKRLLHEAETGLSRSNWWPMVTTMTRMNGAVPSLPCMLSQRADPIVLYASPTAPYVFYDAMLLLAPKIRRQYSVIYYLYIGHSA